MAQIYARRDSHYQAALEFCREMGFKGDDLPPFDSGPPSSHCPVARACNAIVGTDRFIPKQGTIVDLPDDVKSFVKKADAGYYPQLGSVYSPPPE